MPSRTAEPRSQVLDTDRATRRIGPIGTSARLVVGAASLVVLPGAAFLFYGSSMVLAAAAGAPGCEMFVVSNPVLRSDDEIGCPLFTPIDGLDAHRTGQRRAC